MCVILTVIGLPLPQFFLTLAEDIDYLNNKHTVFGEVAEGFEVIKKLNEAYVDKDNRPYQDIRWVSSLAWKHCSCN